MKTDLNETVGKLLEHWYEASAYGDHVPKELPKLIVEFLAEHGTKIDEDRAWEIISESTRDDTWIKLFECLFAEGAKYAMQPLEERIEVLEETLADLYHHHSLTSAGLQRIHQVLPQGDGPVI